MKKYLWALIGFALLSSTAFASSLNDISGNKNETAINYLFDHGIIQGYPDGTFKPENTVNRAELLKILVGGKGIIPTLDQYRDCFPDVTSEWFAPWVCYAKTQGWVDGYPDGSFKPANDVNKVESLKMLINSQAYVVPSFVTEKLFDDVNSTDWFSPYVKVAKDKGLLEEQYGMFSPASPKTRAGISENIYRAILISVEGLSSFSEYLPKSVKLTFDGTGTEVTEKFNLKKGLAIINADHTGTSNFILNLMNTANGDKTYIINEIGSYDGKLAISVATDGEYLFNVTADGGWNIGLEQPLPVTSAQGMSNISGKGMFVTAPFSLNKGLTRFTLTHDGKSNFIVQLLNQNGEMEALYSNNIGNYEGSRIEYIDSGIHLLNIDADGNWTINITQYTNFASVPTKTHFEGYGDTATELFTIPAGTKTFKMTHAGKSNFIVKLLNKDGTNEMYLANEIGIFEGSKAEFTNNNVYAFNIQADGAWTIDIE